MKATNPGGQLVDIPECYISIPGTNGADPFQISFNNLPELSDAKSASYADEPVIGRSTPIKAYSHSETRTISCTIHLIAVSGTGQGDIQKNLQILRAIQSCSYPQDGTNDTPFFPPPVCKIKCGQLLGSDGVCVVLKSYSVRYPTDVTWDQTTLIPYKFDIETNWDVVYRTSELPGQERIMTDGWI